MCGDFIIIRASDPPLLQSVFRAFRPSGHFVQLQVTSLVIVYLEFRVRAPGLLAGERALTTAK